MNNTDWFEGKSRLGKFKEFGNWYRVWHRVLNGYALCITWVETNPKVYRMSTTYEPYVLGHRKTLNGAKNYLSKLISEREPGPFYDDGHFSDCAIHNAPAYPKGKCDCRSDANGVS